MTLFWLRYLKKKKKKILKAAHQLKTRSKPRIRQVRKIRGAESSLSVEIPTSGGVVAPPRLCSFASGGALDSLNLFISIYIRIKRQCSGSSIPDLQSGSGHRILVMFSWSLEPTYSTMQSVQYVWLRFLQFLYQTTQHTFHKQKPPHHLHWSSSWKTLRID